jgi:GT2 family glycosyltransferase
MLEQIGLFDEDFFAYYEDVDLSFRAQLAGWKVRYVPEAIAYHQIGATSSKIAGFTTYQTLKNLPWIHLKNTPASIYWRTLPRFFVAYHAFLISAIWRFDFYAATKGYCVMYFLLPKKFIQRLGIQHRRKVSSKYIWDSMTPGLPPNARKLRRLSQPFRNN